MSIFKTMTTIRYETTFASHAKRQTLVEATELTSVAFVLIYHAVALFATLVHELLTNGSLEEAFATFAADRQHMQTVV